MPKIGVKAQIMEKSGTDVQILHIQENPESKWRSSNSLLSKTTKIMAKGFGISFTRETKELRAVRKADDGDHL